MLLHEQVCEAEAAWVKFLLRAASLALWGTQPGPLMIGPSQGERPLSPPGRPRTFSLIHYNNIVIFTCVLPLGLRFSDIRMSLFPSLLCIKDVG